MPEPTPHAGFREKVHASFARQGLMKTFGGRLVLVEAGHVQIELPFSERLTQQHGYFHAAAVAAIADNAGGYAALTLMRPDEEVVAAEFKVNLLRPAVGARLVADASVVRAGRFLVVSQVTVSAFENDASIPVAMMLQTNFRVPADDDHRRVAGRPRRPVSSASSASSVVAYFSRDKGQSAMTTFQIILRRFEQPDETREFEKGRFELVRIGGVVIGRATYAPGWKWSEHVGPKVGLRGVTSNISV